MIGTNNYAQTTFQQVYGGSTFDHAHSVQQTSDSGFIVSGYKTVGSSYDMYLIKTDALGNASWSKTYNLGGFDMGYCVKQTADLGYIITGKKSSEVCLVKTDIAGNIEWKKTYYKTGGIDAEGRAVIATKDSGYIIAGFINSYNSSYNMLLIKTNSNGDTLWTKTYGGNAYDAAYSVVETSDGGYTLMGISKSFGDANGDAYMVKTDQNGAVIWSKTYGSTNLDEGTSIINTTSGGYIFTGTTMSYGAGNKDFFVTETDSAGNVLWSKAYGGTGYESGMCINKTNGGYIISGATQAWSGGSYDTYLIKINGSGILQWAKTFGGSSDESGTSVCSTDDGGYIVSGSSNSFVTNGDFYLVKTDSTGYTGCNEKEISPSTSPAVSNAISVTSTISSGLTIGVPAITTDSGVSTTVLCNMTVGIEENSPTLTSELVIYPNPNNGLFNVGLLTGADQLEIYNILGESIYQMTIQKEDAKIDLSHQPNGIYFLQARQNNKVMGTYKIMIGH